MATALGVRTSGQPSAWQGLESFEDTVRKGRWAVAKVRAATEDLVAGAGLEVRRHPLTALGIAASAGFVTGCLGGFAAAWFIRTRG